MTTAKVWAATHEFAGFEGEITLNDFILTEETLPPLKDNEILIQALYLSVDPYIRVVPNTAGLLAEQVARIIESKAPGFPKGGLVYGHIGWRSRAVINVGKSLAFGAKVELLNEVAGILPSVWLGAVGMPGVTAYLSFEDKCDAKKGEVIVVSSAAGAVGSIVGQLAKLKGLTVIGLTGSDDKCEYLKKIGFDHAINYKKGNLSEALDKASPEGVDIYYDNVGGDISDVVYSKLKIFGRVLLCGQISTYNKPQTKITNWNIATIFRQLRIQGFNAAGPDSDTNFARARKALIELVQQGKLKAKEHITEGFENMPKAFLELFSGSSFGKTIVKA